MLVVLHVSQVTLVDPAPFSGATGISWAWLNANKKNPRHYKGVDPRQK